MPRPKPSFDTFKHLLDNLNFVVNTNDFNVNTPIDITCKSGHVYRTSITKIKSLHVDPKKCPHCAKEEIYNQYRIPFNKLKEKVESLGYVIIDIKEFYRKEGDTFKIKCQKDDYIHEVKCPGHFMENVISIECPICKIPKNIVENIELHNANIVYNSPDFSLLPVFDTSKILGSLRNKIESQTKWNLIQFTNTKKLAKFQCKNCGYIKETLPFNIFAGNGGGCKGCIKHEARFRIYDKLRTICNNNNLYIPCNFEYQTIDSIIKFTCNSCGEIFDNSWATIVGKYYKVHCPKCFKNTKRKEQSELFEYIHSIYENTEHENNNIISPQQIDIVCPDIKVAIEYSGVMWHSTKYKDDPQYHRNKMLACNKAGYKFIMIFDDEWNKKREICESRIKSILGKSAEKIFARKCNIVKLDSETARNFCNKNHIQGSPVSCEISYGLTYNDKLVSCMVFSKRSGKVSSNMSWELVRYCCLLNHSVPGSASRLLSRFKEEYPNNTLITFSDIRWGDTDFYTKIGFTEDKTLPVDYSYAGADTQWTRRHKFGYDKKRLKILANKKGIHISEDETENTLSSKVGLYRVYDCGHKRYKLIT